VLEPMQDSAKPTTPTQHDRGVIRDENYKVVEWKGLVVFSYAQRGNAIMAHFAAGKDGLRSIKQAINDFVEWAFNEHEWCTMILAVIERSSVERVVKKCGFKRLNAHEDHKIYVRHRTWV